MGLSRRRGGVADVPQAWVPRSVVPLISLRLLQRGLGAVFFASRLSQLGMLVASGAALAYGRAFKSAKVDQLPDLTVISGLPRWAYPRGGVTVGRVFLTGPQPTAALLRHESRHVEQWRTYGLAMPILYWLAGRDAHSNWFEVEAGLDDGGYL